MIKEEDFYVGKRTYPEVLIPQAFRKEFWTDEFTKLYNLYPGYIKENGYYGKFIRLNDKRDQCEKEYERIIGYDEELQWFLQQALFKLTEKYLNTTKDNQENTKTLLDWLKPIDEDILFAQLADAPKKPIEPTKPVVRNNNDDIGCLPTLIGSLISIGIIFLTFSLDKDSIFPILLTIPCLFAIMFLIVTPWNYLSELKEKLFYNNRHYIQ